MSAKRFPQAREADAGAPQRREADVSGRPEFADRRGSDAGVGRQFSYRDAVDVQVEGAFLERAGFVLPFGLQAAQGVGLLAGAALGVPQQAEDFAPPALLGRSAELDVEDEYADQRGQEDEEEQQG
jgi:hypothetical protein